MLEVRLLGRLSAVVDGRPVELPADARARELLARLALSPGPHSRSALAGRLRPDVSEDSARKTLRNALYELRRALGRAGRDAVVATGERVGLSDSVRVDVWEFRRCLADGDLEAAAEAGRGELLDGFDGDWALRARDEHAADLAGVLGTLAARAEDAGDLPAAVAWTRRRLDVEPLAEAAYRELIRLLALDGDRPAALAVARAMSERLRSQLGIPPSAATRALVEDIRHGRIARPAAAVAAASAPSLPAALAAAEHPEGRGPALARLEQAWADAVSGARRFALVTGEPGIGKTTLAGELARRAHAQGGAVLLGRSDEHALVPFQPWIEALEHILEALPAAAVDHWLTAHDGPLARLLPTRSPAQASVGDHRERYLAFELVRALLDDVAEQWPVLLVLEDVHWADVDSLSLLRHLARSAPHRRLLALLCARPAELERAVTQTLAELRRAGPLVHVDLTGLDDDAVAALVARRTGATDHESARRYVPLWRATLALLAGRWVEAGELAERALALGRQADDPNAPLFVGIQGALSLFSQRRIGETDRARLLEGGAASPAGTEWLVWLALLDAETGATEDARRLVCMLARDGASALAMDANWHGACILAEAAVLVTDREAGAALYALLEPHARLFPVVARAVACLGSGEHYVGRLAGLLGRHDEAVARLRRAVAENDRAGAGPHAATALLRLGETLTDCGQQESARDVLQQAAKRADALDMPTLAADAARLLSATIA